MVLSESLRIVPSVLLSACKNGTAGRLYSRQHCFYAQHFIHIQNTDSPVYFFLLFIYFSHFFKKTLKKKKKNDILQHFPSFSRFLFS